MKAITTARTAALIPYRRLVDSSPTDPADLTVYEGVPSATVARALIDCRDMIMHDRLLDAVCTAKRTGLLHAREVQRVLDAIGHDG